MFHTHTTTARHALAAILLLTFFSCRKVNSAPPMEEGMDYIDFKSREIKAGAPGFSFDMNGDGRKDILFFTMLVGDPINQVDKLQFLIGSNIEVNLPVRPSEEIPVMQQGDQIKPGDFDGYAWYQLSSVVLVQKIMSMTEPPQWEGHWRDAVHRFAPYQVVEGNNRYSGWVELTVDIPNERIVLHRAALSRVPNKIIAAGQ